MVMNNLQFRGNWNEIKTKLKTKYPNITDEDLTYASGSEDDMLERLQLKTGVPRDELRREINSL